MVGLLWNTSYTGSVKMTGGTIQSGLTVGLCRGGKFQYNASATLTGVNFKTGSANKLVVTESEGFTIQQAQVK